MELNIMGKNTLRRLSALENLYKPGNYGNETGSNIIFEELSELILYQVAFWPETFQKVGKKLATLLDNDQIPQAGQSIIKGNSGLLYVEPLKFWSIGLIPEFKEEDAVILDLSHSRTRIRVSGESATELINRFLPLDFREHVFPIGQVASTSFHHVGITLWRTNQGYEIFLPRGFALSLWELLIEGASQFGYEVVKRQYPEPA